MTIDRCLKRAAACTACLLACLLGARLALAENSVMAVTAQRSGNSEQVRIDFAQELTALPKAFATRNPARIVLDFPGLGSAVGMGRIAMPQTLVDSALVAQSDTRSRVVIHLRQAANYRLDLVGKSLMVALEPMGGAAPTQMTTTVAPAASAALSVPSSTASPPSGTSRQRIRLPRAVHCR